jgi:hypothetical protein
LVACYVFQIFPFQHLDFGVDVDVEVTATLNLKGSVVDGGLHFVSLKVDLHSSFYHTCGEEIGIDCENQMRPPETFDDVFPQVGFS